MKKIIRFVTSIITLTAIAFLGLFGVDARADDATFTLQQQEALDTDAIRYVSKMTNISDLSEIQYIDVKMQLSKYNSSTSTTDYVDMQQEVHLTKVYKTVNTDGCKEEKTGVYYAVYTLTGLSEYYPGWTITTHFEYVYNSETKVSTNESTYTFPTACKTLPTTVYAAFPMSWVKMYAYLWNSETEEKNDAWPGVAMTETGYIQDDMMVYSIDNPDGKYNRIIITDGTSQTVNIPLSSSYNMYTCGSLDETTGKYAYNESTFEASGTNNYVQLTFTAPNEYWSDTTTYIYPYSSDDTSTEHSGYEMTYLYTNEYGQRVYSSLVDASKYDTVIFSNNPTWNSGWTTVEISFNKSTRWYCAGNNASGHQTVATW